MNAFSLSFSQSAVAYHRRRCADALRKLGSSLVASVSEERAELGEHREVAVEETDMEDSGHLYEEDGLMRVNIYAEETTPQIEIIEKTTPDGSFTGIRFWLHLPVTLPDGSQA